MPRSTAKSVEEDDTLNKLVTTFKSSEVVVSSDLTVPKDGSAPDLHKYGVWCSRLPCQTSSHFAGNPLCGQTPYRSSTHASAEASTCTQSRCTQTARV